MLHGINVIGLLMPLIFSKSCMILMRDNTFIGGFTDGIYED